MAGLGLILLAGSQGGLVPSAHGQVCCTVQEAYRLVYETAYEQRQVTAYRIDYETVQDQIQVTTYQPQWVTETREHRYTVRRQLPETSFREEQFVQWQPTVTCRTATVDQGGWADQVVYRPGPVRNSLRWLRGACVLDPASGTVAYRPGGLYWVPVQRPGTVEVQKVWVPNPVTVQIPQTAYTPTVQTRRVPVTTYRVVSEERVDQVPVQVCKMVPVTSTVTVPRVVEKRVPVVYSYCVPRTVVRRVPVEPTICCQTAYVVAAAGCTTASP